MLLEEMAKELNVKVHTLQAKVKTRSELKQLTDKIEVMRTVTNKYGTHTRSRTMTDIADPELFKTLYQDTPESEIKAVTDIYNRVYENLYIKMHELFKAKQVKIIRNLRKGYLIIQIRQTEKYFIRVSRGDWTRQIELIPPEYETDSYSMIQANQRFLEYLTGEPVSIPASIILLPEPDPLPVDNNLIELKPKTGLIASMLRFFKIPVQNFS